MVPQGAWKQFPDRSGEASANGFLRESLPENRNSHTTCKIDVKGDDVGSWAMFTCSAAGGPFSYKRWRKPFYLIAWDENGIFRVGIWCR